jgi:hypothetical protein
VFSLTQALAPKFKVLSLLYSELNSDMAILRCLFYLMAASLSSLERSSYLPHLSAWVRPSSEFLICVNMRVFIHMISSSFEVDWRVQCCYWNDLACLCTCLKVTRCRLNVTPIIQDKPKLSLGRRSSAA